MTDRRGSRFLLEAAFLGALAAGLAFAKLSTPEIAGGMLLGWLVVAAFEWAAWRGRPHFGSGLPPRYYVPQLALPPARPLEQVAGYPDATRDEAPTWIASADLRAEVLGAWPVVGPVAAEPGVPTAEEDADPDSWTLVELPPAPLDEDAAAPESLPAAAEQPVEQAAPRPGEETGEPEQAAEPVPRPEAAPGPPAPRQMTEGGGRGSTAPPGRLAWYRFDPLAEAEPRRRLSRRRGDRSDTLEVPARPSGPRPLPGAEAGTGER